MSNYLIIYVIDNLLIGGIECYIYKQIKAYSNNKNMYFCWAGAKHALVDDIFKELINNNLIWTLNQGLKIKKLKKYCKDFCINNVKIITFDPFKFAKAEAIKHRLKRIKVDTFYFVPHFEGESLYLEEGENLRQKKEKVRSKMALLFQKMNNNENIKYFAKSHIAKMTSNYQYNVKDEISVLVPPNIEDIKFNIEQKQELYNRGVFKILSVSRFEFPHKGYLIGLIRAFASLKPKYPQLELVIVGYGDHKFLVDEELAKIRVEYRASIKLVGRVSPDQLFLYYDDANLNISVAGACSKGAKRGCLSVPARHYTYDCEVYGFLPESKNDCTSTKAGMPVEPLIEEVLNMKEEEYIQKCLDSFNAFPIEIEKQRKDLLLIENKSSNAILNKKEIKYLCYYSRKYQFREYIKVFKREGLLAPIFRRIKKRLNGNK